MFYSTHDSEAALDLQSTLKNDLKDLKKEKTSIYNRLHSINEDAQFVERIATEEYPQLPVIANLRCGAWYVDPQLPNALTDTVYFKSTDGHIDHWGFNLRRANLHILPIIQQKSGIIIVDSTRKGKRLPDALSKTVPIWCCVINNAVSQRHGVPLDTALYTPPSAVSRSEATRIEANIPGWASKLLESSFPLPHLTKPLRPLWVTRSSAALPSLHSDSTLMSFHPVICLSASEQVQDGIERRHGYSYVQGSGDDHESWSQGLTPLLFWQHRQDILVCAPKDLEETIPRIISEPVKPSDVSTCIAGITKVSSMIEVGTIPNDNSVDTSKPTILIRHNQSLTEVPENDNLLQLNIPEGKAGQLGFMSLLSTGIEFAALHLRDTKKLVVLCQDGKDRSIGVAMAILQLFFREDGSFIEDEFNCAGG
ncbi:hypothetical protein FRC03_011303 [Tulasnella sp. 419]|nr:hypothetical protein FRC03_011303 [Tulasnella sp. 419]